MSLINDSLYATFTVAIKIYVVWNCQDVLGKTKFLENKLIIMHTLDIVAKRASTEKVFFFCLFFFVYLL